MALSIASTTIGIILAITASIFNAVGYTVQKQGHNRLKEYNKDKKQSEKKRLIHEKIWVLGFVIYLVGGVLNAISLFYAPQSLVLPLSAVTLVANTILATKILGEPLYISDMFGVLSVIIGSVLAVLFGPRTNGEILTMNELKLRWIDEDFYPFFLILSVCTILDFLLVRYYEKKNGGDINTSDDIQYAASLLLVSYCVLAAYFGSLAFIFLKSFTQFIGALISNNVLHAKKNDVQTLKSNWYSYITVLFVVITNIALEVFRQRGLSRFNAVYVVPIIQVVLIVMGTVMGGIYFEEFRNMEMMNAVMFSVAIAMTVIGVFILALNSETSVASRKATDSQDVDDEIEVERPDIYVMHRAMASISLFAANMNHVTEDVLPTCMDINPFSQSEVENVLL